jgi:hypothetical protein
MNVRGAGAVVACIIKPLAASFAYKRDFLYAYKRDLLYASDTESILHYAHSMLRIGPSS